MGSWGFTSTWQQWDLIRGSLGKGSYHLVSPSSLLCQQGPVKSLTPTWLNKTKQGGAKQGWSAHLFSTSTLPIWVWPSGELILYPMQDQDKRKWCDAALCFYPQPITMSCGEQKLHVSLKPVGLNELREGRASCHSVCPLPVVLVRNWGSGLAFQQQSSVSKLSASPSLVAVKPTRELISSPC